MAGGVDPYAVLGVRPGAGQAEIHAAYRAAVRRTHPDAGGSAAAFEAVQEAYETLRDTRQPSTGGAGAPGAGQSRERPDPARRTTRPAAGDPPTGAASSRMEALLAESRRLEDEARRLAGLPPRERDRRSPDDGPGDSAGAILRDARDQLREAADIGARELRRRIRRLL
ncbi:MAG TPA: DnaJ domain-containing protein [Solirubrobacteraceae bacterium]